MHPPTFCFILKQQSIRFAVFILLLSCSSNFAWSSDSITDSHWQEDISTYLENLEQGHMNLFHTASKARFYDQTAALRKQLPKMSNNEILVRLMEITRMVGDGHTSFPLWGPKLHKFPIKLIAIDQRLFVSATTNENRYLLKSELIAINGRPIAKVFESLAKLVPFAENAYSTQVRVAQYIPMAEVLNGAGFIDSDYSASFTFIESGKKIHKDLLAKVSQNVEKTAPLDYFNPHVKVESVDEWLWFSSSSDKRSVYIKFERYPNLEKMEKFAVKLLSFINENQSENLVIDLRNNYGGDFFTGLKLAQYLVLADSINWQSGNYVLINNVTFSAAMSNAAQFNNILNAKLVGEPTGAKPKGYQDMGEFTLPRSKRVVTYSKRFYDFMGKSKDAIYPENSIKLTVDDYQNNLDKQLEWVLRQVDW
jgi:hypothetical protein